MWRERGCCPCPTVQCGTRFRSAVRRSARAGDRPALGIPRLWIRDGTRNPTASNEQGPRHRTRHRGRLRRGANPLTLDAKKTVAFEVWEQLGRRRVPDVMIAPVGDGPRLVALDKGFGELVRCGLPPRRPRHWSGCRPSGASRWCGDGSVRPGTGSAGSGGDGRRRNRVLRPTIAGAVMATVHRTSGGMLAAGEDALLRAVGTLATNAGLGTELAARGAGRAGMRPRRGHGGSSGNRGPPAHRT